MVVVVVVVCFVFFGLFCGLNLAVFCVFHYLLLINLVAVFLCFFVSN